MKTYKVKFYRSGVLRKWRWRVTADNGNIIGGSTQGYWNRKDCEDNVNLLGACLVRYRKDGQ